MKPIFPRLLSSLSLFACLFLFVSVAHAQQQPAASQTPTTPNHCVYRCAASGQVNTDSDEYGRWRAFGMPLADCRTGGACRQQCEIDCASRSGGGQQGETASGCDSVNPPSNAAVAPQCSEDLSYARAQGETVGGVCLFKCPGAQTWNSGFFSLTCNAQSCGGLCGSVCGQPCGTDAYSCQPIPGQGQTHFSAVVPGPTPAAPPRAGAVGPYGLRDPLGGATPQRLIAGFIRYLLGFVGALFFGMFIWGGLVWMTAGGDMDKIKTSKSTLVNAVIGMFIVAASYTIVYLITQLPAVLGA